MPVAKSYQSLAPAGEVYTKSNKTYIDVYTKTGAVKTVRWYSDKEYARMYPEVANIPTGHTYGPQKEILGFTESENAIIIYVGEIVKNNSWFEKSTSRYHRVWGWYSLLNQAYTQDLLPEKVFPIRLSWNEVGNEDGYLIPEEELRKVVIKRVRMEGKKHGVC